MGSRTSKRCRTAFDCYAEDVDEDDEDDESSDDDESSSQPGAERTAI
jgi:hypothetical protein